ncbi:ECF transporter S component [Eubacteriales bacterium OttesenSCG-928-M02]|nr:ECF transporter S component [Eubacteriales bacterium OttesenSCG-928-M02]
MERRRIMILTNTGLLAGISILLMLVEFPIPPFPSWFKFGFSDIPGIIGGLAFGPWNAVAINVVKNLVNIMTKGLTFGGVGEIANLLMATTLALPAAILYKRNPTRKNATIGLLIGVVLGTAVAVVANVYFLLPATGIKPEALRGIMSALTGMVGMPNMNPTLSYALLGVVPFNLLKMGAQAIVVLLIYKYLVGFLHRLAGEKAQKA